MCIRDSQFNSERNVFAFLNLLYTLVTLTIRYLAYCFRLRYPRLFRAHLVLFYILDQLRYSVVAYYKASQVEQALREEMSGVYYKTAQEQMVAHMFAQLIFLSPTFGACVAAVTSLIAIESSLVQIMLNPGDDEFIRNIFAPILRGFGAYVASHVLLHREIKQFMTERRSNLKWQQMMAILDSQSDAIIAIQTEANDSQQSKEEPAKRALKDHPVMFSNKKSMSLFGYNLMSGDGTGML